MNINEEWELAINQAALAIGNAHFQKKGEAIIEAARDLLAAAHRIAGVDCKECCGGGEKAYPDTSTWLGSGGVQIVTRDVCDRCWGTGRSDTRGIDLRAIFDNIRIACKELEEKEKR